MEYNFKTPSDKMRAGIPLSDEDRIPWLQTLRDALNLALVKGETVILGCSALKKHYRDILRHADPGYMSEDSYVCAVKFVLLSVEAEVLVARLEKRAAEGKHFMPAKLLQSQLELLQMDESEGILIVDASLEPQDTFQIVQAAVLQASNNPVRSDCH